MRSYLSLIPISAKVRRRQNRMTLLCILISVFLVTAVFGMADMAIRMEHLRVIEKHGNWHIMLSGKALDAVQEVAERRDVAAAVWYRTMNYNREDAYEIGGKRAVIVGAEQEITAILEGFTEGSYPRNAGEVILTANAKTVLGVKEGDLVKVNTPGGSLCYTVSGFQTDTLLASENDAFVVFMLPEAYEEICALNPIADTEPVCYIQFKEYVNCRKVIADLMAQYGWKTEEAGQNTALLGITGFSDNTLILGFYLTAAILGGLILLAGAFMIAGSLNSNVAERTQFFGMLRCIGASRKQIRRLVRREALSWCKTAVPAGCMLGVVLTWGLCALLKYVVKSEFDKLPVFQVSAIGILSGAVVGILTVFFAAQAPARRASRISPVAAVSGNIRPEGKIYRRVRTRFGTIETRLGRCHAMATTKNLILMTGSFALSILLFLSFSVMIEFGHQALAPLRPYSPDLSIMSADRSCIVDAKLVEKIRERAGVRRVFGRMWRNLPASYQGQEGSIDLISYEQEQFRFAKESLVAGEIEKAAAGKGFVLAVHDKSNSLKVGDKIQLAEGELEVAGVLDHSPFDGTSIPTIICSEETFTNLTGERRYAVIDIQLTKDASGEEVNALRVLAGDGVLFSDRRESNQDTRSIYTAFVLFVYGFLFLIVLITVLNIMNSVTMSVSAKIRQYGIMRAVGMDSRQMVRMIAAETFTYGVLGMLVGCGTGWPLYRFLFRQVITAHWGIPCKQPLAELGVIVLLILGAAMAAIYAPAKRIRNMVITETINEL